MSVYDAQARLHQAVKDLHAAWRRTSEQWNDPASRRFAKTYLTPMQEEVRRAASAMTRMDQLLSRVKRECEPDR